MNIPRRNSQFLGFTQTLLNEHRDWLRRVKDYSDAREEWGRREQERRRAAVPQLLQGEKDWDGSESDLVGLTNAEVGE